MCIRDRHSNEDVALRLKSIQNPSGDYIFGRLKAEEEHMGSISYTNDLTGVTFNENI